ncbi:Protein four-jointed, partial [Stegodyphus mimosarum]
MKPTSRVVLPITMDTRHPRMDPKLAVPVSFVAGILIGIPITYCVLFLPLLSQEKEYYVARTHHEFGPLVIQGSRFNVSLQSDIAPAADDEAGHVRISVMPVPVPRGEPARTRSASSLLGLPAAFKSSSAKQRENPDVVFLNKEADDLKEANPESVLLKLSSNSTFVSEVNSTRHSFQTGDLVDGVFWTSFAEKLVPKGFDDEDITRWKNFLNHTQVLKLEEGCGRMQNRLIILEDGGKSCCRYR